MSRVRGRPERALKKLRGALRAGRRHGLVEGGRHMYHRLPDDLATEEWRGITISGDEVDRFEDAEKALEADPRFEYLRDRHRQLTDAVWQFVFRAVLYSSADHIDWFLREYERVARTERCFMTVDFLGVSEPLELRGVTLLPLGHEDIPDQLNTARPCKSVAVTEVVGTSGKLMGRRARVRANDALRVLRVGLREERSIHPRQLHFHLGSWMAFESGGWGGGSTRSPFELELGRGELDRALAQPLGRLLDPEDREIDRKALIALEWLERSLMTPDAVIATLYAFFALEAIVGDKSEGKKAKNVAFMMTMLGHAAEGHFKAPWVIEGLYEEVRSTAVHGGEVPVVPGRELESFQWSVRRALNQFLEFADAQALDRTHDVRQALLHHPDAHEAVGWLREMDATWDDFDLSEAG